MATLLPLLLLLLLDPAGSRLGLFAMQLQDVCDGHIRPGIAVQAPQCPEPPCHTATDILTLALPVLLSLDTDSWDWSTELWLYNESNDVCGVVKGTTMPDSVELSGKACDKTWKKINISPSLASGGGKWTHVGMVTEGQQVKLYLHGHKDIALTLTHYANLPTKVVVVPHGSRYGYSALTTTTSSTTTATTTPTNLNLNSLVVLVVVVVVGLVLVVK